MTIFTGCGHCGKAISFDLPNREYKIETGKAAVVCKVACEQCEQISEVFVAILPTGEQK